MATTSDLNAAIAKGAADAIEILEQAAKVIDGEWQRVSSAVAASDTVPEQVKQAVAQLDDAAASVRREAANVADDLPENLADGVEEVVSFFGRMTGGCASPSSTSTDNAVVPVADTVSDVATTSKAPSAKAKSTAGSTKSKSTAKTKSKATAKTKKKSAKSTKAKATAKAKPASKSKAKASGKAGTKKRAAKRSTKAKSDKSDS